MNVKVLIISTCYLATAISVSVYGFRDPTAPPGYNQSSHSKIGQIRGIVHSKNRQVIINDQGRVSNDQFITIKPGFVVTKEGHKLDLYPPVKTPAGGSNERH